MSSNLEKQRRKTFLKLYAAFQDCIKTQPIWGATISHFDFDLDYPEQWPIETRSRTYGLGTLVLPEFKANPADLANATNPATADDIARSAGDQIMKGPSQSFNVSISVLPKPNDEAAADKLVELLREAGSAMTESLRSLIPLNCSSSGMPYGPSGLFLAFMFWSKPLSNEDVLQLAKLGWVHWTFEPCRLAKDTIERCRLAEDSPNLFPKGIKWPTWAGYLPETAKPSPSSSVGSSTKERVLTPMQPRKGQKLEWLAKAMLLVRDHPEWADCKIAKAVDVAPSTLSRNREFKLARKMAVSGSPKRGYLITKENSSTGKVVSEIESPSEDVQDDLD